MNSFLYDGISRSASHTLGLRLREAPAVVLLGPRQVGKTTLARAAGKTLEQSAIYLDMEREADRRKLDDADAYLRAQLGRLVIIDEVHRVPQLFETLRGIIDDWRAQGLRAGHFLLLGSAGIELLQQSSETLAGRVALIELTTLNWQEVYQSRRCITMHSLWLRGGFPDSLLASSDAASLRWRRDFIRSYLERDVPMFAPRLPAQTIGRLWQMLAHLQGSQLNQANLAQALAVSLPTVARYLDLLDDLLLVRRLQPWHCNVGKRLSKTPKAYVRDSGVLHGLLTLKTIDDVLGHPVAGASFEGFVIENVLQAAGETFQGFYYRTHNGAEIDLLLVQGGEPRVAIEIKKSSAPSVGKGFTLACDDLAIPATHRFVVYSGEETYPMRHGVQAIGLLALMEYLSILVAA